MSTRPTKKPSPAGPSDTAAPPGPRVRGEMRSRILKAAARLLATRGFDGTTLQAVADEVGVRKPSVLHHFPSKEALRKAVLEEMFHHWNSFVPKVMLTASQGASRFDALAGEMVRFFTSDPNTARVILREMLDRPEVHRRVVSRDMSPWFRLIGHGIEEGKRSGRYLPEVDSELYLAHIFRFILVAIATSDIYGVPSSDGPRASLEREVRELLRIARVSLLTPDALHRLEAPAKPERSASGSRRSPRDRGVGPAPR